MWSILHMTVTSLAAVVALRTDKTVKMVSIFLKEEKICYKLVYYVFNLS